MSDTYNYEVLEPGGHARLVGNVLDRISEASANPASAAGSSRAMLGDTETASWMERTTAADGAALIESVKGNTLAWNQLVGADTSTVTIPSGHKYHSVIGGTSAIATSDGTAISVTGGTDQLFDLTAMFGSGNEPATVAEFEALFPEPYYPYDAGSLLPVRMEGVETNGFNQWDEQRELGSINPDTGATNSDTNFIRTKNFIDVFPSTAYCYHNGKGTAGRVFFYDIDGNYITYYDPVSGGTFTTPANCRKLKMRPDMDYGTTYNNDICINISDPSRNGTYEPHWSFQRTIPASTYFTDGMRSAGSVCDELTEHEAIHRVGAYTFTGEEAWIQTSDGAFYFESRDNSNFASAAQNSYVTATFAGTLDAIHLTYNSIRTLDDKRISAQNYTANDGMDISRFWLSKGCGSSVADVQTLTASKTVHYALTTPATTPIDPPLPMSYRVGAGGTERVMVASGTTSAPPIFATRYPLTPDDIRDRIAATVAPVEQVTAQANHAIGELVYLGWSLYKVTSAIATGETITPGTNVTETTVAAELAALSE